MSDVASPPIALPIALDSLDLAALLCSRVCHDVISPVGAIVNGLEVLDDDSDQETQDFALALIRKSAQQASARLQFARLAFGAAGSAGASIDLGDAEQVTKSFLQDDKVQIVWQAPRLLLAKNKVKLLLNLLVIAAASIVRGGTITVSLSDSDGQTAISITAQGPNSRMPPHAVALIAGESATGGIDAHGIQAYYTGLVARASGMAVTLEHAGDTLTISARST
ncbi:MAG TPA: histidine phosphotransferase family protein [Beijerinckiaceae bacterium]|nr:histidine phosphotransferase family protein [Beijerinckiaceae bacterium]